ncbi:MAG: HDIG domain-containing metalloprotein [Patescibacteria group bacterium]
MIRQEALEILHNMVQSQNLRKHCYAVGAVMATLALKFEMSNDKCQIWEIAGLLHDADYEKYPKKHPSVTIEELEKRKEDPELIAAIKAHAWGYREGYPKPESKFEWSLYICDELTGLIVACALVRPDRKLASVDVASVMKKWNQKSFAAGVDRSHIELCDEKLGIKLPDFIQIALSAMQAIAIDLGL